MTGRFAAELRGGRVAHWTGAATFCRLEHETAIHLVDSHSNESVVLLVFARDGLQPGRVALLSDRGALPTLPATFASVVSRLKRGPGERPWETAGGHVDLQRVGDSSVQGSFDAELRLGAPRDFLEPGTALPDTTPLRMHGTFTATSSGACILPNDVMGT